MPGAPSSAGLRRRGPTTSARVDVVTRSGRHHRPDRLVTEEPLEVRVQGPGESARPLTVTMRTPGDDFDLALGLVVTEGVVEAAAVRGIAYCLDGGREEQQYNVVTVRTAVPVHDSIPNRSLVATAACGLCGKTAIEDLTVRAQPAGPGPTVAIETLLSLPGRLGAAQGVFAATGGLHAAARFGADGDLIAVREDIGRHNALDKLIGDALRAGGEPIGDEVLLLSGRAGFELVQKAAVAGFPIVASVSAPSSLAVATARELGMTLVGFLRDGRANVYCGADRVAGA